MVIRHVRRAPWGPDRRQFPPGRSGPASLPTSDTNVCACVLARSALGRIEPASEQLHRLHLMIGVGYEFSTRLLLACLSASVACLASGHQDGSMGMRRGQRRPLVDLPPDVYAPPIKKPTTKFVKTKCCYRNTTLLETRFSELKVASRMAGTASIT